MVVYLPPGHWKNKYQVVQASRDLLIPDRLRSPTTFDFGSRFHHPKKVTFARRIARMATFWFEDLWGIDENMSPRISRLPILNDFFAPQKVTCHCHLLLFKGAKCFPFVYAAVWLLEQNEGTMWFVGGLIEKSRVSKVFWTSKLDTMEATICHPNFGWFFHENKSLLFWICRNQLFLSWLISLPLNY